MNTIEEKKSGLFFIVIIVFLWSFAPVFLKHLSHELDAWTVMGVRYTLAGLFLLPVLIRKRPQMHNPWRTFKRALIPGLVFSAGQILWSTAPYYCPAGLVMFIGRCSFLFSIVFGFILLKSELGLLKRKGFWLGTILTICGLLVLLATKETDGANRKGIIIMFCAALFWGMQSVSVKYFLNGVPATVGFSLMVWILIPFTTAAMFLFGDLGNLPQASTKTWLVLIAAGVLSIGVGQLCAYIAIQREGPITVEGCMQIVPFTAVLTAWFILGEKMTISQWIAGGFLVTGSVLVFLANLKKTSPGQ